MTEGGRRIRAASRKDVLVLDVPMSRMEQVRRQVSALPVSVLRKYHKSAEIAFLYRKAALRSYFRGHDPLLIDLREKWGLER
jgi:hypothetical protein